MEVPFKISDRLLFSMHNTHYGRGGAFVSIWIIHANRAYPSNAGGSNELSSAQS
jgi:hypothetical protein